MVYIYNTTQHKGDAHLKVNYSGLRSWEEVGFCDQASETVT